MNRFRHGITLLLLLLASTQLFAQAGTTEVGGALVFPSFDSTNLDEDEPVTLEIGGNLGFEAAVNHFWTDRFSTELALTSMTGDVRFDVGDAVTGTVEVGELDLLLGSATALWHFGPIGGRVDPYVGGGLSYITGSFEVNDVEPGEDGEFDLENEVAFVAAAGLAVRLSERVVIGGAVRYIPYEAKERGAADTESLDVNPLIVSTYVRLRF